MNPSPSTPRPRVTMQDVAERVGLSKMSVSLALRGSNKLSPITAERVRTVAKEMGYVPDPLLRALNVHKRQLRQSQHGEVIAVVDNWQSDECEPCKGWLEAMLSGIGTAGEKLGYSPQRFPIGKRPVSHLQRILLARGISSIIQLPDSPKQQQSLCAELDVSKFSIVRIGRSGSPQVLPTVAHDHFGAMQAAFDSCLSRGYRRPAFIQLAPHDRGCESRYSYGFHAAAANLAAQDQLPVCALRNDRFPQAEIRWFVQHHRPDVVIGTNSALLHLLYDIGYRVPDDLGFVSLEALDGAENVSGVHLNVEQLATTAVDLIEKLLHRNIRGYLSATQTIEIGGILLEGGTLRSLVPSCSADDGYSRSMLPIAQGY